MRKPTLLALCFQVAWTPAALVVAGCSAAYPDESPGSPNVSSRSVETLAAAAGQTSTTKHAGISLINAILDSSQHLLIYVDGAYLGVDSAPGGVFATMAEGPSPQNTTVPDGFPDGRHVLALESADGQKLLETEQDFVAGAWSFMYVYGSINRPFFKFFTEPAPSASNKVWVRMVNLMRTQEPVDIVSCTLSACEASVASSLAYGDSWSAEVPTSIYGFAFTSPAGGSLVAPAARCTTQPSSPTAVRDCSVMSATTSFAGPGPY
jgi:hypothetical protein